MAPVDRYGEQRPRFGAWLLQQRDRGDQVDQLAARARADANFPRLGDPDDVRRHLLRPGGAGELLTALDHAELDWCSY